MTKPVKHTARVGKYLYDILKLESYMSKLPVNEVPLSELQELISKEELCWNSNSGRSIGPYMFISDWEGVQEDKDLEEHVQTIRNADIHNKPIWLCNMPNESNPNNRIDVVLDGMHRLTKAFIKGWEKIKFKRVRYEDLPLEARVEQN